MAVTEYAHDVTTGSWRDAAACQSSSPDLFFPVGTVGPALVEIDTARDVCARCDVRAECLEFALATNQEFGVWGGTSEEERRRLRRAWRAKRSRPVSA